MVYAFLRAEISSKRFRERYLSQLKKDDMPESIVIKPDIKSKKENAYRRRLLGLVRGYKKHRKGTVFRRFPDNLKWYRAHLTKAEFLKVKYINWTSGWTHLVSKGTRLPIHAAKNLKKKPFSWLLSYSDSVAKGKKFPELILVSTGPRGRLVVLEGHGRITGMAHQHKHLPEIIEVIVGFSKNIRKWDLF
jgi:hypothetical protein